MVEFDLRILGMSTVIWLIFAVIMWVAPYRETFGNIMTIGMIIVLFFVSYIVVWMMDNNG